MLRLFILDRECNTHLTHFRCSAMTHTQHPDSVNNKELYEVVCFYLFSYRWVWKTDSTMLSGVWPGVHCGLLTLLWAHLYIEHKAADQREKKKVHLFWGKCDTNIGVRVLFTGDKTAFFSLCVSQLKLLLLTSYEDIITLVPLAQSVVPCLSFTLVSTKACCYHWDHWLGDCISLSDSSCLGLLMACIENVIAEDHWLPPCPSRAF